MRTIFFTFLIIAFTSTTALAAPKPIKFKIKGTLPAGSKVLAIGTTGKSRTADITSARVSIRPAESKTSLYILGPDSKVSHQIVNKFCSKAKTGTKKGRFTVCNKKNKVNTQFRAGADLKVVKVSDGVLLASLKEDGYQKSVVTNVSAIASNWVPAGIKTLGLGNPGTQAVSLRKVQALAAKNDSDQDGLASEIDVDDDGDGVLDNYDADSALSPGDGRSADSFYIFSNLKLDLTSSLNLHATGLSKARTDTAIQSVQTMAIEVAGTASETVELDCGGLNYCSPGGTGTSLENSSPFPGNAGGSFDSDSDGLGTITRGPTNDFQLKTNATSDTISAGDTFIQRILNGTTEREATGILNFVFHSTPAIKTLTVQGTSPVTVDYGAVSPIGSRGNCFQAPASGDVVVTIEGWRPQRPGIAAAGESEYVDLGNSYFSFDIPNAPCDNDDGFNCNSQGVSVCPASVYSTTDPNMTVSSRGAVQDLKGDINADSSNTYTLTANISSCLTSGSLAWNAGQTLFIDLAAGSLSGDNAAQKFCITRSN